MQHSSRIRILFSIFMVFIFACPNIGQDKNAETYTIRLNEDDLIKLKIFQDLQYAAKKAVDREDFREAREAFLASLQYQNSWKTKCLIIICDDAIGGKISKKVAKNFFRAREESVSKNSERALPFLSKILLQHPQYWPALFYRGYVFQSIQMNEDALKDYSAAIRLAPDWPGSYSCRAEVYKKAGNLQEALADYNVVLAKDSSDLSALTDRGAVLNRLKKYDRAVKDFESAGKMNNSVRQSWDYYEAFYNRGIESLESENYEQAVEDFTRAAESQPKWPEPYLNRGRALRHLQRYDEALQDILHSIGADRLNASGYYHLGLVYADLEEYGKAIRSFNRAVGLKPDYTLAYFHRAEVYYKLEEWASAVLSYDKTIQSDPNYVWAYYLKGISCEKAGQLHEAAGAYQIFINKAPDKYFKHIVIAKRRLAQLKRTDFKRTGYK